MSDTPENELFARERVKRSKRRGTSMLDYL